MTLEEKKQQILTLVDELGVRLKDEEVWFALAIGIPGGSTYAGATNIQAEGQFEIWAQAADALTLVFQDCRIIRSDKEWKET